jgi:predicted transcriptional regulator
MILTTAEIRNRVRDRGIRVEELAAAAMLPHTTVYRLLNDKSPNPREETLRKATTAIRSLRSRKATKR